MGGDNGGAGAGGQPRQASFPKAFVEDLWSLLRDLRRGVNRMLQALENQLFNKDLMRLSNSSKLCSPLTISPLMKKVGVEFTFKTSEANF